MNYNTTACKISSVAWRKLIEGLILYVEILLYYTKGRLILQTGNCDPKCPSYSVPPDTLKQHIHRLYRLLQFTKDHTLMTNTLKYIFIIGIKPMLLNICLWPLISYAFIYPITSYVKILILTLIFCIKGIKYIKFNKSY